MLTLIHAPLSRSSRIIWLLEELGAEYEIRYVDIRRWDGSGGPDENNPHPHKQVPALLHDGTLIWESVAVVQYLTDLYPDCSLSRPPAIPSAAPICRGSPTMPVSSSRPLSLIYPE